MRKFLMLAMAVVLSLSSAFATTVYCKMTQSWWTTDGAAVAVHYWGGASAGTTWPGARMTSVTGEEGMWSYDVPSDVTGIVFVRVNGSGDVTDWGAKTKDLTLPTDGKNLFTITNSSPTWGSPGCDGEWSTYVAPASGYAGTYTSDITLTTTGGTSASTAKVVINEVQYDAIKAGTTKVAGAIVVTVPANVKTLHFHALGWKGETVKLSFTGVTADDISLTSDDGVSSNSPFTLKQDPATKGYFSVDVNTTAETKITLTATSGKRFVLFGVNKEDAPATPAKYYITGDSALVVDAGLTKDKAWSPAAIKAESDTTVLTLKAGVEYKLKVTVDGTWDTALGYAGLSKVAEGLSNDADGNIVFKLSEAGAVKVVYFKKGEVVTFELLGKFYVAPVEMMTVYFWNNLAWETINAYVFSGEVGYKAWPGEAMKKEAEQIHGIDVYAYTFPKANGSVIFNNGTDQTADLTWEAAKPYFVAGAKNAEGKYEGKWYAKEDIPAPVVPGKYYITGDSALVVDAGLTADKAWAPAAIKADADTTVLNLKAGVEYKLKVTVDGTWNTALGYDALSEKAEGLIADADGNICFKLAEAGAVQVIYFKEGDVVTFKVLGNFYIKPVIVETLKLVPNMWSEAGAKMAAWTWGKDLAGAWTAFFAGEGDTLTAAINAEADSVIFVRFNSAVAAPTWDEPGTNIWNRVKDDKIDHVGLTYTITAWGDEGISVGQWTPYEPVVPGKYYITGDSALVVDAGLAADQAWNPAAIKADADTTVLNLKAGVDYKLKVTVDGTWATALGYDNLSEKAEGLSADADNNICFKLAEAGAVQVVYFKEGEKVTYELIGNFYVKPVIVETLNLVPNMWSEASAKMAAWVWGEDLAGAWTPFFAGEGDTLSVKINAEADSIIFVRFNSAVAAPTWDEPGTNIWNRVKDDKIDHVGLTYTITAWGDEGISVGQWTPYEPVVPGKYYITGDSALVVDAGLAADQAWNPAAIKADADTTVLNLKTGVEYKLKVTVDGTWNTALGFDALSEKAEGLIADADGNICFKLAEAGAVQVIYFKEGDVVTFKVLGKFYIKPVIVETLKLVPNMWSEAGAKMAAWVWGEGLAGAWTPFFAGEGDTLSVKIDEQADSVIFVRFASEVAAPAWEATIWNRVKDEEIDHVGLTYTITAWGDEGISVGQWTPYEPVVPGKYYITGDSALVVDAGLAADQAWNPAAIKADADTTVLNLKGNVDYKLKITLDGQWATALGYDNLSEKAEGLSADADNNICFKLAEAGAVQVVYFKEGEKVTYELIGNFYVKPVIVETLNLVPNMWSEASAKMAAWVWGEGLAGAWTPFFAGEGDTLSVKIDEQADSVIFVRFASEVAAPDWEATIWNRVKDDKIDHVGLTYTITAWGDEGISVGQWTPYEPAGGCDWDNLPWLGSADAAYAEQFKVCVGDPKPTEVVNIQKPGFATEIGIYITFPSAAFTSFSLPESAYDIQGAGVIFHLSAFTARETEVTVVCESKDYIFTVFNKKGGEPVCKDKYGLKVGETIVEFAKNEAQTEWVEYYKQGVELTAGDVIVLYNICEDQTFAAKVAGYEGLTPLVGGDGWTVTETAKYDFYLKLIFGADELYVVKQGSGDTKYYMKNNWNAGSDWTWKEMTPDNSGLYKLENVVFGGIGVNYNTEEVDETATWVPVDQFLGDQIGAKDTVSFVLDPVAGTVTATLLGKYVDPTPGDKVYTIVGVAALVGVEWNPEATDNDMAKQADGSYKLVKENVALASGTYDYKVVEGHSWDGWQIPVQGNQTLNIEAAGVYNVTFTLDAALTTLTANAVSVGPMPEQEYGLMIDGTTFIKAQPNPATANEYMVLDVALTAGQTLQIYDKTHEVGWAIDKWNEGSYKFEIKDNKYIVSETAKYDFYVNLEYGNDYIYVAKKEGPSAIENLVAPANELRKVMIDGKLYILRDGRIYTGQGQLVR